jgi:hypothetical protein
MSRIPSCDDRRERSTVRSLGQQKVQEFQGVGEGLRCWFVSSMFSAKLIASHGSSVRLTMPLRRIMRSRLVVVESAVISYEKHRWGDT